MYALLPPACVVSDLVRGVPEHCLYGAVPALLAGSEVVVPDRLVGSFGDQAVAFLALFERLLGFLSLCDVYGDGDRASDLAGPRPHRRIPHLERPRVHLSYRAERLACQGAVHILQYPRYAAEHLRDRTSNDLARLEPQSAHSPSLGEGDHTREVDGEEHDGHVRDDRAQPELALFARLLRVLALGDVVLDPQPVARVALLIPDQHGFVPYPHHPTVFGELPELHPEGLASLVGAGDLCQHPLAVCGVHDLYPLIRVRGPLLRLVAEQRLHLRAYVGGLATVVDGLDVGYRRDLLGQGAVPLLNLPEPLLRPLELRDVVDDPLDSLDVVLLIVDPLTILLDVPERAVPAADRVPGLEALAPLESCLHFLPDPLPVFLHYEIAEAHRAAHQ